MSQIIGNEDDELVEAVTADKDVDPIKLQNLIKDLQDHEEMLNQIEIQRKNKLAEEKRIKDEQERISKQYECTICHHYYTSKNFSKFEDFKYNDSMSEICHNENVCNCCFNEYVEKIKLDHVEQAIQQDNYITVSELIDILNLVDKNSKISINISDSYSPDGCQVNHNFYFRKPIPKLFTTINVTNYYNF